MRQLCRRQGATNVRGSKLAGTRGLRPTNFAQLAEKSEVLLRLGAFLAALQLFATLLFA